MAVTATRLDRAVSLEVAAIAATAAATAAPGANTVGVDTGNFDRVRTYLTYVGTVNAAAVRVWFYNRGATTWHRGASTTSIDPLAPGGASPVNEARDWVIGRRQIIYFQLESVSGGGTVALTAAAVFSEKTV